MAGGWLKYQIAMNEKEPTVHLYGLVLLHDLVQMNVNEHPDVRTGAHALKKRFGIGYDRDVEFLPYWENGDKYRVDSTDIVISFYRKGASLLAILVSKSMKNPFHGTVEISTGALGADSVQTVEVYDPLADTYDPVKVESAGGVVRLNVEIQPTLYKAVLINTEG